MCTASAALHTARDARTGKIEGVEVSEEGVGRETMVKPGNRWVVVWGGDRRYLRRLFRNPHYDYKHQDTDTLANHLATVAFEWLHLPANNFSQVEIARRLQLFSSTYRVGELGKRQSRPPGAKDPTVLREAWQQGRFFTEGIYSAKTHEEGKERADELQKDLHMNYIVPKLRAMYMAKYGKDF
ncbi:hypothetical protein TrRE_jg12397 [Triparma retinervis]|uniref:Uncharacterized protein n=1 Tax=Triparma retinervis TaxID=2557542 RepID=A0A9W6ZTU1_9STRA|nr:hypothetical protein TrRE_jg12397 [Triparma retinervis]